MFLFSDVIDQLEIAEASLNSIVNSKGEIPKEKYNRVISFLNTALSDLYTRFDMVRGQCVIQTVEGMHRYKLKPEYAQSVNPKGFIVDSPEFPFLDTVLEITSVSTMEGVPLLFNVMDRIDRANVMMESSYSLENCVRAFSSPVYAELRTPVGLRSSMIKVNYKVGHTPYKPIPDDELSDFLPDNMAIDLPYPFLMPIVFYICSRVNNGRGSERAGQQLMNEGNGFFSKYLAECRVLQETMSQATVTADPVDTFSAKGFV